MSTQNSHGIAITRPSKYTNNFISCYWIVKPIQFDYTSLTNWFSHCAIYPPAQLAQCLQMYISAWFVWCDPIRSTDCCGSTTIPTDIVCSACNLVIFVSNQYSSNWTDCRAQLNIFENSIVCSPGAQPSFRLISLEIKLLWICESLDWLGLCWDFPQSAISFTCRHSNLLTFQRSVLPPPICRPITARSGGGGWPIRGRIQHTDWIVRILERTAGIFDISIMLLMIHQ